MTIRNQIMDEVTKSQNHTVKKTSNCFRNSIESTKLEPIEEKANVSINELKGEQLI